MNRCLPNRCISPPFRLMARESGHPPKHTYFACRRFIWLFFLLDIALFCLLLIIDYWWLSKPLLFIFHYTAKVAYIMSWTRKINATILSTSWCLPSKWIFLLPAMGHRRRSMVTCGLWLWRMPDIIRHAYFRQLLGSVVTDCADDTRLRVGHFLALPNSLSTVCFRASRPRSILLLYSIFIGLTAGRRRPWYRWRYRQSISREPMHVPIACRYSRPADAHHRPPSPLYSLSLYDDNWCDSGVLPRAFK